MTSLPEKKHKRDFIVNCEGAKVVTAESINESIKEVEERSSNRSFKRIRRNVLSPVVTVLKDFYIIIEALGKSEPLSLA